MRSFYIACAIIITIVALIFLNSCYIIEKTNLMLSECSRLSSEDGSDALDTLHSIWNESYSKLSLSIHRSEIERAESALYLMTSYYKSGDATNYRAQLEILRAALDHISDAQKFSFDSIF